MLPQLPKKNKKKEADFGTTIFKPWMEKNASKFSRGGTFELKTTTTDSIPFSCVEDLQIDAAMSVKWSDKGYLIRNLMAAPGTPDYSLHYHNPAFVVIKYPDGFVFLDIETFIEEKRRNKRKSLTWDRALLIANKVVKMK